MLGEDQKFKAQDVLKIISATCNDYIQACIYTALVMPAFIVSITCFGWLLYGLQWGRVTEEKKDELRKERQEKGTSCHMLSAVSATAERDSIAACIVRTVLRCICCSTSGTKSRHGAAGVAKKRRGPTTKKTVKSY